MYTQANHMYTQGNRPGAWHQHNPTYKYAGMGAAPPGAPLSPHLGQREPGDGVYWPGVVGSVTSVLVLLYTGGAYNLVFLGRILPACGKTELALLFGLLFNPLWLLTLWSYYQASFADPGYLPQRWRQFVQQMGIQLPVVEAQHTWQTGAATNCDKCMAPRPDRAHHCKVCKTCVMRMDHHCPWINNCVGFHNHKFFLLLVVYGALAGIVGVLTGAPWLMSCITAVRHNDGLAPEPSFYAGEGITTGAVPDSPGVREAWAFLVMAVLGAIAAVLLSLLAFAAVANAVANVTTIEQGYPSNMNPFDQESAMANLVQVLGMPGLDWLLPVLPWAPVCDGIVFPARGMPQVHGQAQAEALWHLWYGGYKGQPGIMPQLLRR